MEKMDPADSMRQQQQQQQQQQQEVPCLVSDLSPNDVLLGRGTGPNEHEGNIRFREQVHALRQEYQIAKGRGAKTEIARSTVKMIKKKKGRFLRKLNKSELRNIRGAWGKGIEDVYLVVTDDETLVLKTKQTFRHQTEKIEGKPKPFVTTSSSKEAVKKASAPIKKAPAHPDLATSNIILAERQQQQSDTKRLSFIPHQDPFSGLGGDSLGMQIFPPVSARPPPIANPYSSSLLMAALTNNNANLRGGGAGGVSPYSLFPTHFQTPATQMHGLCNQSLAPGPAATSSNASLMETLLYSMQQQGGGGPIPLPTLPQHRGAVEFPLPTNTNHHDSSNLSPEQHFEAV
jgi:hypothetical protein